MIKNFFLEWFPQLDRNDDHSGRNTGKDDKPWWNFKRGFFLCIKVPD